MNKISKFEKVSFGQFKTDFLDSFPNTKQNIEQLYESIQRPRRATTGSAGYDFYSPIEFYLEPGQTMKIPTGIRARMDSSWVLMLFPRSGLGFKYRLQLNNTVGVIDSDYYHAKNEGHIFIKITNDSNEGKVLSLDKGDAFAQGIFLPFGITEDDDADGVRVSGLGSTSEKK